jgi:hypothetical protein
MPENYYDELARPLGYLVMAFNDLEVALGGALMRLLKQDDDVGAVFVAHLNCSTKLNILEALEIKIYDPNRRAEFHETLRLARDINTHRNTLVHSEYTPVVDEHSQEVYAILHRRLRDSAKPDKLDTVKGIFKHIKPVNAEEIMDLANDAAQLASQILSLSEKFHPAPRS